MKIARLCGLAGFLLLVSASLAAQHAGPVPRLPSAYDVVIGAGGTPPPLSAGWDTSGDPYVFTPTAPGSTVYVEDIWYILNTLDANVTITTGAGGGPPRTISFFAPLSGTLLFPRTLRLVTDGGIYLLAPIGVSNLDVVVDAGGQIVMSAPMDLAALHLHPQAGLDAEDVPYISAGGLSLEGSGTFNLQQPSNMVGSLQANVTGPITYRDASALAIGTSGVSTGGYDVTVISAATLTVNGPVSTTPGTGGVVVTNASTVVNAALTPGAGDITLLGFAVPVELMRFAAD